eukprot:CAMPEP_0204828228 /NCGR_PEP_ID=MMETSP1346-20131115/5890_1 /ASSEMBLY_ACC=CAM_ASM_000771 /TAXON_ID=215587 /ORGANISM="Aplanochytrium stocchinoi, Strain GSBS06" /LENGTH=360 /DNA_ID=CAMNT_0051957129 /DNA_START=313 /DNA_END=1396 /DNA_ORIENTATION=+
MELESQRASSGPSSFATIFIAGASSQIERSNCEGKLESSSNKDVNESSSKKSSDGEKGSVSVSESEPGSEQEDSKSHKREKISANYAAVILKPESVKLLKERFPALFPDNQHYHHMTVKWAPNEKDIEEMDDLLDNEVTLKVVGVAQDDHCQALLVKSEHLHIHSTNRFPHITLSVQGGDSDLYHPFYSNELFERIFNEAFSKHNKKVSGKCDYELLNKDWSGKLPKRGKYAETKATFETLADEEMQLQGCFCLDTKWNSKNNSCEYTRENQCGFCLFMKGGPCRNEFMQWEECVGVSKDDEDDEDFVDRCAPQTLMLKTCVDNNPEYYYIVTEDEGDSKKKEDEKDQDKDRKATKKNEK